MLRFFATFARSPEEISLHTEAAGSAPPDAFGPFRVLHQIGAGALGPVFRAYDPEQDKLVAVKLFRLDLPPERVHQFVAALERLIAADLTHTAIAAPLATGIVQASAFLAQDFVAADSLDTVVREHGPAPSGEGLRIITQLAGALDFAAVVGVFHGALHPRDVLICPDDVRVTGLGIARALEQAGAQAPIRRPYAASERVTGANWDRRADIFSLAALAHELFWGRRLTATGAEAAAGLVELPGASLQALRDAFGRALSDDPAVRFPAALDFAEALKNCFSRPKESVVGSRESRVERLQTTDSRLSTLDSRVPTTDSRLPTTDSRLPTTDSRLPTPAPLLPLTVGEDERAEEVGEEDFETVVLKDPGKDSRASLALVPELPVAAEARGEERDDLVLRPVNPVNPVDPLDPVDDVEADTSRTVIIDPEETVSAVHQVHPEPPVQVIHDVHPVSPVPAFNQVHVEHPLTLLPPESPARSAVWPLSLALVVGLAVGFAGGYGLGQRQNDQITASTSDPAMPETEVQLKPDAASPAELPRPTVDPPSVAAPPAVVPSAIEPSSAPPTPPAVAKPKPAAEPAVVARTGRITVRTTPAGARVLIDGRDVGKTPLTIPNLNRGTHSVRVSRDGYTTIERRVSITTTQPTSTLSLNLTRAATPPRPAQTTATTPRETTSLFVESRPTGATVFIDGKRVGTTPMSLSSVTVGAHAIRLELAGFRPWTSSVRVVAGEKNRVAASLEQ